MAHPKRSLSTNAHGDFFVDDTCIDCGTCYWVEPKTFARNGSSSHVHQQPSDGAGILRSEMALLACPTASIGTHSKHDMTGALASYPDPIEVPVYHTGFHDESSFGAAPYLIVRPDGNVLVDSPRFTGPLVKRLEELGGVDIHFLTHRDDVGDHERFHEHFDTRRVLHRGDISPSTSDVEIPLDGNDEFELGEDLVIIPTPGHTRGSACLLYQDRFLFTGDHVAWSERLNQIYAFRRACWYDWEVQKTSMRRLAEYSYAWILPGHGVRCNFEGEAMRQQMRLCLDWMDRA